MQLQQIGYFSKTHGVKGQLVLRAERDFDANGLQALFVDNGGNAAPFFVSALTQGGAGHFVSLEDIDTVEKAKTLVGKAVLVEASLVKPEEVVNDWTGFELHDHRLGNLGAILEISDNGAQLLASLQYQGREVILPLADALIQEVDTTQRVIRYNAPEGLIEVYLEGDGEK